MSANPETQYTSEPVCPHCGGKYGDPWEIDFSGTSDERDITCGHCESEFIVTRLVTVEYCTRAKAHEATP